MASQGFVKHANVKPSATVRSVLNDVFNKGKIQHPDGKFLDIKANISLPNSNALRQFILATKPQCVVEIGMAYGVSTLTILGALEENGLGNLISIDPYIGWPTGKIVALHQVERAEVGHRHQHMCERSYSALPKLLSEGLNPDLVYIDGDHKFDYVFTDFFFADKLIDVGGIVAFNDSGWRSVYKVIRFLGKYRRYREHDVGLPRIYDSRNLLFSMIKRIEGRSTHDRYFEKIEAWEPGDGFHRFF